MKKRSFINLFAILSILFFSLPAATMDDAKGQDSKIPTLRSLAAQSIFCSFEEEAKNGNYNKISMYRAQDNPTFEELIFSITYTPNATQLLNFPFMSFFSSVNLKEHGRTGNLGNIIATNPTEFLTLSKSKFLKCMSVSKGQLGAHMVVFQHFTNLTSLTVGHNKIGHNISTLTALTGLTNLGMNCNRIGLHLSALTHLTRLASLYLSDNDIGHHITALTHLTGLTILDLSDNDIGHHITALTHLTGLASLDVSNNNIGSNVGALTSLTHLTKLDVSYNETGENVSALIPLLVGGLKWLNICEYDFDPGNIFRPFLHKDGRRIIFL